MDTPRYQAKLFATDPSGVPTKELIPVFHRWIQERRLDEVVVDVADYGHVHEGPGVLLVCHEGHYATDLAEGRFGIEYRGKRGGPSGGPAARLRNAVRKALVAARHLEVEPAFSGRLRFSGGELLVGIADRLSAPSMRATFDALAPHLEALAGVLYGGARFELAYHDTPNEILRTTIRAPEAPAIDVLLSRLDAS